jgi:streptogramin lyase
MTATLSVAVAAVIGLAASNEPNSQPNPYRTIDHWGKLPAGRTWGSTAGIDVDAQDHVWVAERCGANSCAGSKLDPILEFDTEGNLLKSFGAGMFVFPHGVGVDKDGNVWVTDGQGKDGKGQQVIKFVRMERFVEAGKPVARSATYFQSAVGRDRGAERRYLVADGHGESQTLEL